MTSSGDMARRRAARDRKLGTKLAKIRDTAATSGPPLSEPAKEILKLPEVRRVLQAWNLGEGESPPAALANRIADAAMPAAYQRTQVALMFLVVFPCAFIGLALPVVMRGGFQNSAATKLIGVVPFFALMTGFFGGLCVGVLLANRVPMRQAMRERWDEVSNLFGGRPYREITRREVRPFSIAAMLLFTIGLMLAAIPGRW